MALEFDQKKRVPLGKIVAIVLLIVVFAVVIWWFFLKPKAVVPAYVPSVELRYDA